MFSKVLQIFRIKELRVKVLFVLGMLAVFRMLAAIPVPGVDPERLKQIFESNQLLGFLNIFSGGALSNFSVAMLGVAPYITATIIMQLLTMIFPKLKQLYYEEGAAGRAKFNRISRYLTVPLACLQAYGFLNLLSSPAQQVIAFNSYADFVRAVIVVTAGTMLLMWIGELITEKKIGNGISLIIFAGIVADLPSFVRNAVSILQTTPSAVPTYIAYAILSLIIIAAVVAINEGERKVPISYAKQVRGNRLYGGVSSYLPLKVNQAGVIPIIFAISILLFPQFIAQIGAAFRPDLASALNDLVSKILGNQIIYGSLYFALVFIFTYFYTAITFDPKEISQNLQKNGGFIPGIRPGLSTAEFLSKIIKRITFFGAIFLGFIAVLPNITQILTGIQALTIGGTAMLIVVSVALETMKQIESQLVMREYEGF
ncbi:MAG: preprotein translocase subunit SecY [Parcubacteria group bacterium RIFCSPLOWO2_01_FULL_48_18]|nr:MAG: preprotein translocase subunit SecY [Parcubacteria group bacterium RIFCSPLOWO2_01_FULL_48_18]OHB24144.1 MAG: preprotein translocase subunit SecY [Parcubacteria group bacterium RIFCSPHIGHO2_02_FULL_48_10b]